MSPISLPPSGGRRDPYAKARWNVRAPALRPPVRMPKAKMTHEERYSYIVAKSLAYFAQHGFNGGIRGLSKYLGISQSLIYHYFSSKEELVRRVNDYANTARRETKWEELLTRSTSPDRREMLIDFYIKYLGATVTEEWTRYSLLSAMSDLELHDENFNVVREKIFPWLLFQLGGQRGRMKSFAQMSEVEIEFTWQMHTAFFYLCIRDFVFRKPGSMPKRERIALLMDTHIAGYDRLFGGRDGADA